MTRKHSFCARRAACSLVALGCGIAAACSNEGPASLAPAAEAQKTPVAATDAKADPAKPLPKGAFQVKLAEIPDPTGFGGVAARVLIPMGWRTEGGVVWAPNLNCAADPASFGWAAVSPDGASRIELFPSELWQASNSLQTQCMYGEFQNVESYLTAYVQRRYPGARRIEYRSRTDFLDLNKDYLQASIAIINNSGTGMNAWADAGELVYSHTENGVEMRGVVSASARFYASQTLDSFNNRPMVTLTGGVMSTFAARGPAAEFDPKMAEMIRKSVKPDYAWAKKYTDHKLKIGGANVEQTRKTAAIIIANGAAMTAATIAANQAATRAIPTVWRQPSARPTAMPAQRKRTTASSASASSRSAALRPTTTRSMAARSSSTTPTTTPGACRTPTAISSPTTPTSILASTTSKPNS